jgi:uncharacterized SAM-binding protein YcdF (DUF218 family)
MTDIDENVRRLARVLWDYHVVLEPVDHVDFILALGSHDERVAMHAAALMRMGLGKVLVASGGAGKVTGDLWRQPEAERYADVMATMGILRDAVLVENGATNTGENLTRTRDLLASSGLSVRDGLLVAKPYMARRSLHTARAQWPEVNWQVSVPPISFDSYASEDVPEERMINLLVGDLQRMWVFADKGFQSPAEVPKEAVAAYEQLVARGFDQFVLAED